VTANVDRAAVCTVCLADVLRPLIEQEWKTRPPSEGRGGIQFGAGPGTIYASLLDTVAEEAGVSKRLLGRILKHEHVTTSFYLADRILCAFDRPDLVHRLAVLERQVGRSGIAAGSHCCALALPAEFATTGSHDAVARRAA
jgi:hypothetical protein